MKKTNLAAIVAVAAVAFSFAACDKSDDPEPNMQTTDDGDEEDLIVPLKEGAGEAIDLGLPSGTLWADRNVGASECSDYGWYLAWGETEPKEIYDWSSYKYASGDGRETITKYQIEDNNTDACWYQGTGNYDLQGNQTYNFIGDGKSTIELSDDAARVNWGGRWRMPTIEQFGELNEKCTWTWTTNYNDEGVAGYNVMGPNGNAIFLPAAGCRYGSDLYSEGSTATFWSAELYSEASSLARDEGFDSGVHFSEDYDDRNEGFSVRPVISSAE